ncbi:hypothetical protein BLOT_008423 [Blomia tropicalis]|nr:hypothetical protein BLOT_008423 [Blomia tropicalis]
MSATTNGKYNFDIDRHFDFSQAELIPGTRKASRPIELANAMVATMSYKDDDDDDEDGLILILNLYAILQV